MCSVKLLSWFTFNQFFDAVRNHCSQFPNQSLTRAVTRIPFDVTFIDTFKWDSVIILNGK